jgi:hypothetical protein
MKKIKRNLIIFGIFIVKLQNIYYINILGYKNGQHLQKLFYVCDG